MRRNCYWAAWLLVMVLPVAAADKGKKGDDKSKHEPTQAEIDALVQAGKAVGKIGSVEGSTKGFTLIYEYQTLAPNKKNAAAANRSVARQQQQLIRQYNQIMKLRNPVRQAQRLQQFIANLQTQPARVLNNLFKVVQDHKDFNLQATEEVKVRLKKLPLQYDEKGKIKEYTAKEKKELKGKDPKLPGYTASWDNLAEGQTVKVYFQTNKKKSAKDKDKADAKAKDKGKDKDADKDKDEEADETRPQVRMIMILDDPNAADKTDKGKKDQ